MPTEVVITTDQFTELVQWLMYLCFLVAFLIGVELWQCVARYWRGLT